MRRRALREPTCEVSRPLVSHPKLVEPSRPRAAGSKHCGGDAAPRSPGPEEDEEEEEDEVGEAQSAARRSG